MRVTNSLNWGFRLVGQCFIFQVSKKEWSVFLSWSQIWGKALKIPLKSRTRLKTKFSTSVKAIFRKYFEVSEFNITLLPSTQIFKLVRTTQTNFWPMILRTLSSYFLHLIPPWLENLFIYNNNTSKKKYLRSQIRLGPFC